MEKNEITINGIIYHLEKDDLKKGCADCDLSQVCDNFDDCLTRIFTRQQDYIFKRKETTIKGRLFPMMDKNDSIVVLDRVESIKIGGNYPFLGIYDLKVNGQTYFYGSYIERTEAYRKLWQAMEE